MPAREGKADAVADNVKCSETAEISHGIVTRHVTAYGRRHCSLYFDR